MIVTRMDLDGKGAGSPAGLVTKILKAEPGLTAPVPIEDLARQLDILEIRNLTTDGFEGGLITDAERSNGFILVNSTAPTARRRFTIGHELGHFLMPTHKPIKGAEFMCSRNDMRQWLSQDQNAHARMEAEANEFAALILMPPPLLRASLNKFRDPDLTQVVTVAKEYAVSKEAAARAYAKYHDEAISVVVTKDGTVNRTYRSNSFPFMSVSQGQPVPKGTIFHRTAKTPGQLSAMEEVGAEHWLQSEWGKKLPVLCEQVMHQQDGYALILLWAEIAEEEEKDDERTAKERYRDQQARWS